MRVRNEKRFEAIRIMIKNGHITEFGQIFDHIPKTVIKEELKTNNNRITHLVSNIEKFTLEEILIISNLLKVDFIYAIHLAANQILKEEKRKEDIEKIL